MIEPGRLFGDGGNHGADVRPEKDDSPSGLGGVKGHVGAPAGVESDAGDTHRPRESEVTVHLSPATARGVPAS